MTETYIPVAKWRRLLNDLWIRSESVHESGAFLLGSRDGERRCVAEGILYDDVDPELYAQWEHAGADWRFPGGESLTEMQTRVTSALARLVLRHPGATIVAVSHADPIKAAVAYALGVPLDLFQRIVIGTASITVIAYGPDGPLVLGVNSAGGALAALGLR